MLYVPSKAEPADDDELKEHILDPLPRPLAEQRPNVTDLPGIRSHFCFRVKDGHTIYMRVHSCHCEVCLSEDWLECKNEDAGPWEEMPLQSVGATRAYEADGARRPGQEGLSSRVEGNKGLHLPV